ncbi:MAG: nitroreductase family protein [Nocardioides sp.]
MTSLLSDPPRIDPPPAGAPPAVTDLLRDRWSPRSFDPTHTLADNALRSLLEAARWAPSAGNSQPWSFLVARRGDRSHRVLIEYLARGNAAWAPKASAVLLAIAQVRTALDPDSPSDEVAPGYSDYAEYDVGQAVAHLTIQARALGLETRQFAGFDHLGVSTAFAVPDHFKVLVGVAVGRHLPLDPAQSNPAPSNPAPTRVRKELADFAFAGTWGHAWASPQLGEPDHR